MKVFTDREIRRTLAKYDLHTVRVELAASVAVEIAEVRDAYSLLDTLAAREQAGRQIRRFPYWAEIWPSAAALARWLHQGHLARPATPVLELGCGLGLVGVGCARLGWAVEATDYVEDALVLAAHNGSRNGVAAWHRVRYLDWATPTGTPTGLIVGSDLAYEKANHALLARVLRDLLRPGGVFCLGDPGRPTARALVDLLRGQGYHHEVDTLAQRWKDLDHRIDIHRFHRPSGRLSV